MFNLKNIFSQAKTSSFYLWLLNWGLSRKVPFNRPHGFRILKLGEDDIETLLPFKTLNLNHIKSLHACALATVSEFSTGAFLLSKLDPARYRLILKELKMEYHYQGKTAAKCRFGLSGDEINKMILKPLESGDSVLVECIAKTFDNQENHLATGNVTWQIKDWSKVKTKI